MTRELMGFQGYAPGAIKTRAQLTDLIAEAGKTKRAIRLYAVEQGGHMSELFITSRTKITIKTFDSGWQYESFKPWARSTSTWSKERYYQSERSLADLNILGKTGKPGGHNRHQLFSNRRLADEYAAKLRGDARYQQAIKDFHRRMYDEASRWGW